MDIVCQFQLSDSCCYHQETPLKKRFLEPGTQLKFKIFVFSSSPCKAFVIKYWASFYENQTYQTCKIADFGILLPQARPSPLDLEYSRCRYVYDVLLLPYVKGLRNYLKFVINYYIFFQFQLFKPLETMTCHCKEPQKSFSSQTCSVKISADLIIDININKIKINIHVKDVNTG